MQQRNLVLAKHFALLRYLARLSHSGVLCALQVVATTGVCVCVCVFVHVCYGLHHSVCVKAEYG